MLREALMCVLCSMVHVCRSVCGRCNALWCDTVWRGMVLVRCYVV